MVVAASTTTTAEEAPLSRRKGRRRHRQSIIAAAAAPQFRTPRPPTRPRPSGAAATTTATERESRSSRIRRDGLRRRARQLQRMKRVVDGHALKVAAGEKTKKQQHVYDLTASSSAPSAASASQRWRGVMRRVRECCTGRTGNPFLLNYQDLPGRSYCCRFLRCTSKYDPIAHVAGCKPYSLHDLRVAHISWT